MHNNMSGLTPIDGYDKDFLKALLKDGRSLYPNRKSYDADVKWVLHASMHDLYLAFKDLNRSLIKDLPKSVLQIPLTNSANIQFARQVLGFFRRLDGPDAASQIESWKHRVATCRSFIPKGDRGFCMQLISRLLGPCPNLVDLVPRHGPGAVATGERGWAKADFKRMYRQLLNHGGVDLLHLNDRHLAREPYCLELLDHPITRVIEVPKDFTKKRVISAEPLELQFLQQAVARHIMRSIEKNTRCINFTSQLENRSLAKAYKSYATLDMSNASDLVSRKQVKSIFPADWSDLLFALRSHFAATTQGTTALRAFAPMGSALCFPIESIVFYVTTSVAMLRAGASLEDRKLIRIYGDDIIVPIRYANAVIEYLREVGFEPNLDKCCTYGRFRESCGAETWESDDISIESPRSFSTRSKLQSMPMVSLANRLYIAGYAHAAAYIAKRVNCLVATGYNDENGHPDLPWRFVGYTRFNRNLQRLEQQRDFVIARNLKAEALTGYKVLFMHLVCGWRSDMVATPYLKVKRGWCPICPLGVN